MKILILYSSVTGNTKSLARSIQSKEHDITCLGIENFKVSALQNKARQDKEKNQNSAEQDKNACRSNKLVQSKDFSPDEYDLIFLGFWVYRGKPDPRMLRLMQTLRGKQVAVFGTLAAWPDSAHARKVLDCAENCLQNNAFLGGFLCLGRLTAKRLAEKTAQGTAQKHPMTEDRKQRLLEGQNHPNQEDFCNFQKFFEQITALAQTEQAKPSL